MNLAMLNAAELTIDQLIMLYWPDHAVLEAYLPHWDAVFRHRFFHAAIWCHAPTLIAALLQGGWITDQHVLDRGVRMASGNPTNLAMILGYGGNVNAIWNNASALHAAIVASSEWESITVNDTYYRVPHDHAVFQIFLEFGVDRAMRDGSNKTAYEVARDNRLPTIAAVIMDDPPRPPRRWTVHGIALPFHQPNLLRPIRNKDYLEALYWNDWTMVDDWIGTPSWTSPAQHAFFEQAVWCGASAIMEFMLDERWITDQAILNRSIHYAVARSRSRSLAQLLAAGGNPNHRWDHDTPLHRAVTQVAHAMTVVYRTTAYVLPPTSTTIQVLLDFKADPTLRDAHGRTPADLATAYGLHDLAVLLQTA